MPKFFSLVILIIKQILFTLEANFVNHIPWKQEIDMRCFTQVGAHASRSGWLNGNQLTTLLYPASQVSKSQRGSSINCSEFYCPKKGRRSEGHSVLDSFTKSSKMWTFSYNLGSLNVKDRNVGLLHSMTLTFQDLALTPVWLRGTWSQRTRFVGQVLILGRWDSLWR